MNGASKEKLPKEIISATLVMVLGALPPMLDATIVNIAINDLTKLFATTLATVQWVVTGYALALGVAVPLSGWLVRKFDGKKVFMLSLMFFMLASLLSGFSQNIEILIVFRIVQGFAAGILIPTLTTLIVQMTDSQALGRVMSVVSIPVVFGPIIGPVIGGLILQYSTWHWLFFVNLPFGVLAIILIQWKLPKFEAKERNAKFDWIGISLLTLVSGMFILGISEYRRGSVRSLGLPAIIVAVTALFSYVIYARKVKEKALIPFELFHARSLTASFAALFLAGFAINGPLLLLPMFFQNARGLDVITSALWLIPQGVGMLITRSVAGKMTDKIGARFVALPAIALMIIGTMPFVFFGAETSQFFIWGALLIRGMGVGAFTIPIMSDSYSELSKSQIPAASVATRIIQNIGSAFGSALLAAVVTNFLERNYMEIVGAYHAGFVCSLILMVISIVPALFLTNKLRT